MKRGRIYIGCCIGLALVLILAAGCEKEKDDKDPVLKVTDADGNVYNTVQIGTQTWMAENLRTTKYRDGTSIPNVTDDTEWSNLSTPGYCWYDNDKQAYGNSYGALYNWHAVNTGNLCPAGWHVPSDAEFVTLTDYLGGELLAGAKLNENDSTYWIGRDSVATNSTGFSARPGGYRNENIGNFALIKTHGFWWSSKNYSTTGGWMRSIEHQKSIFHRAQHSRQRGFSVRCLKD